MTRIFPILALALVLGGCVSSSEVPPRTPEQWQQRARPGSCDFEKRSEDEYAFFDYAKTLGGAGTNPTERWTIRPGLEPGHVVPAMVSGLRLKPAGEPVTGATTRLQPFITENCQRLYLDTSYTMDSLAEEQSIYKVSRREELENLVGQQIVLTEVGGEAYGLPAGTRLTVTEVSDAVESPEPEDQNLKLVTTAPNGESYSVANRRAFFTTGDNSDAKTLAAFSGHIDTTWETAFSSEGVAVATHSPLRSYGSGLELRLGLRCEQGRLLFVVHTDTFINQNSQPFTLLMAFDHRRPLKLPMTVFPDTNMAGFATASPVVLRALSEGHTTKVRVVTWDGDNLDTEIPLIGARQAIDNVTNHCQ